MDQRNPCALARLISSTPSAPTWKLTWAKTFSAMHRPINIRFIRFQFTFIHLLYRFTQVHDHRPRTHVHSSALLFHASSRPPTTHPRSFICSTLSLKFTTTDPHPLCTRPFMLTFTLFTSLDLANSCPRALPQLKHPSPSSPTRFTQRCSSSALAFNTCTQHLHTRARTVG